MQKQRSPGSIYTGIIKNTYRSTFGSYIKELLLLVQKYWQLISIKQFWSVPNIVSSNSKSWTVQYRVPRCPGQYWNVQYRVPRCLGFFCDESCIHANAPDLSRNISNFDPLPNYRDSCWILAEFQNFSGIYLSLIIGCPQTPCQIFSGIACRCRTYEWLKKCI
jgi:hypothetical protein